MSFRFGPFLVRTSSSSLSLSTAAGCGSSSGGAFLAGTGTMPIPARVLSAVTGNTTGIGDEGSAEAEFEIFCAALVARDAIGAVE